MRPASRKTAMRAGTAAPGAADKSLFVFGLGYTTIGLCNQAAKRGWRISGTTRNLDRADVLAKKGYHIHRYDPAAGHKLRDGALESLHSATHVVTSIPPLALSTYDPVLRDQKALLADAALNFKWFGYLSSTGIYGNWDGDWVDEESEPHPCNGKGVVRLEHEKAWQEAAAQAQLPLHIFRLAGIYGPRRSVVEALQKASLSGSQQRRGLQRYTSRCHVLDICNALLASMATPAPGSIYNVADDDPAPRTEVMAFAEQQMMEQGVICCSQGGAGGEQAAAAATPHEAQDAALQQARAVSAGSVLESAGSSQSSSRRERGNTPLEEKRVRNTRIKQRLGLQLVHPTYREGVSGIISGSIEPFDAADLAFLGLV